MNADNRTMERERFMCEVLSPLSMHPKYIECHPEPVEGWLGKKPSFMLQRAQHDFRVFFLLLFVLSIPLFSSAQDISYARNVVDTLAAPGMHGRGYVNDGD